MIRPSLILGISAAFALFALPLAASAGAAYSSHRPAQWQRSHDGEGVMRVYGGDVYRAPEAYTGGEFRGGLDVQTAHEEVRYEEEYRDDSDRYGPPPAAPCRSVCVTAYAPPPPPRGAREWHREVRYSAPPVTARQIVIDEEETREEEVHEEAYAYHRESSHGHAHRRHHVDHHDCSCQARYDHDDEDREDRYSDDYDNADGEYRRDVFGRY